METREVLFSLAIALFLIGTHYVAYCWGWINELSDTREFGEKRRKKWEVKIKLFHKHNWMVYSWQHLIRSKMTLVPDGAFTLITYRCLTCGKWKQTDLIGHVPNPLNKAKA